LVTYCSDELVAIVVHARLNDGIPEALWPFGLRVLRLALAALDLGKPLLDRLSSNQ
jgi:hypothetical protein